MQCSRLQLAVLFCFVAAALRDAESTDVAADTRNLSALQIVGWCRAIQAASQFKPTATLLVLGRYCWVTCVRKVGPVPVTLHARCEVFNVGNFVANAQAQAVPKLCTITASAERPRNKNALRKVDILIECHFKVF